jgi:hypothetical protein
MKKSLLLIVFYIFSTMLNAQVWSWAFQVGARFGIDVEVDKVGNVYSIAMGDGPFGTYSLQAPTGHMVGKQNSNGQVLWANAIINVQLKDIVVDLNGNCYVAGRVYDTKIYGISSNTTIAELASGSGNGEALLIKYTSSGELEWVQTWGFKESHDWVEAVDVDQQGNIYVVGNYYDVKVPEGLSNAFCRKYNQAGNMLWEFTSNWKGYVTPTGLAIDLDGNCFVSGSYSDSAYFGNTVLTSNNYAAVFLASFNPQGAVVWAKKIGSNLGLNVKIDVDINKNIYLTGQYSSPAKADNFNLNNGNGGVYVLRLDSAGTVKAANAGSSGGGHSIKCGPHGGIYVGGQYNKQFGFSLEGTTNVISSNRIYDAFVAKLDDNCIPVWLISTSGDPGNAYTSAKGLATDTDGNIFVTGEFKNSSTFGEAAFATAGSDGYIAKIIDIMINGIVSNDLQSVFLNVFPSPGSGKINIQLQNSHTQIVTIKVTDVVNHVVFQEDVLMADSINTSIDISTLPKGLYFVCVISNNQKVVKKIVLQ